MMLLLCTTVTWERIDSPFQLRSIRHERSEEYTVGALNTGLMASYFLHQPLSYSPPHEDEDDSLAY